MPGPRISHQACHASRQTVCVSAWVFYFTYYPPMHVFICCLQNLSFTQLYEPVSWQYKPAIKLHACMYESLCLWLSEEGGESIHQISYLIWFASGGVKGAVGRLSSLRQKKKGQNQDGVSVKEDEKVERVGEDGREGGKDWDKEWKR